jgi:hypothetical protein
MSLMPSPFKSTICAKRELAQNKIVTAKKARKKRAVKKCVFMSG